MPSGKVFHGLLTIDTDNDTTATPSGKIRTATLEACNDGDGSAVIRAYISTDATSSQAELVEPGYLIPSKGGYIRTFILGPGERILINPSTANVVARLTCFEEDQ